MQIYKLYINTNDDDDDDGNSRNRANNDVRIFLMLVKMLRK
jgi:hypothetical protein